MSVMANKFPILLLVFLLAAPLAHASIYSQEPILKSERCVDRLSANRTYVLAALCYNCTDEQYVPHIQQAEFDVTYLCPSGCDYGSPVGNHTMLCRPDLSQATLFDFGLIFATVLMAFIFFWLGVNTKNNQPLSLLFFFIGMIFLIFVVAVIMNFANRATLADAWNSDIGGVMWLTIIITIIMAFLITIIYLIKQQYETMIERKAKNGL